jgi:hypothetical protein
MGKIYTDIYMSFRKTYDFYHQIRIQTELGPIYDAHISMSYRQLVGEFDDEKFSYNGNLLGYR